jgi:S-DNA-T family DNA segregation ATPase FtsK/SpoIIIE
VPKETHDFLAGLTACLEWFSWETPSTHRTLTISCESRFRKEFRDLNIDAGLYFARRYSGLKELFDRHVIWNVGELFDFPMLVESWRQRRQPLNHSEARAVLQLKFVIRLEFDTTTNVTDRAEAQFIWRCNPQWVVSEFVNGWERLAAHPFVVCRTDREPTSSKGTAQSVDLANIRTLPAAHGRERGSLVGVYCLAHDLARRWREQVRQARERGLLSEATAA